MESFIYAWDTVTFAALAALFVAWGAAAVDRGVRGLIFGVATFWALITVMAALQDAVNFIRPVVE